MNVIDILTILWVLSALVRGYYRGFLHQAMSLIGFIIGLVIGSWLAPHLVAQIDSSLGRLLVTLLSTLGLGFFVASIGEGLAEQLQDKIKPKLIHAFNAGFGMIFSALATMVIIWLFFSALARLPLANIGLKIQESKTLQAIDKIMPTPTVMERFARLVGPHGFPQIFIGNEPVVDPAGPPATPDVEAAAAKAQNSTVKVEGYACGGVSVGSGFVAADGFVVTNAHVLAGVREPVVIHGFKRYSAVPVWFDPELDFAVVRVNDLDVPALPLAEGYIDRGKSGAILGYPGGGRLTIDPAVILGSREAIGRDIYGRSLAARQIYEVQADIDQGNSGGPLVMPDGSVAGIMFGKSVTDNHVSYAINSVEATDDLAAAIEEDTPRRTGACI